MNVPYAAHFKRVVVLRAPANKGVFQRRALGLSNFTIVAQGSPSPTYTLDYP